MRERENLVRDGLGPVPSRSVRAGHLDSCVCNLSCVAHDYASREMGRAMTCEHVWSEWNKFGNVTGVLNCIYCGAETCRLPDGAMVEEDLPEVETPTARKE